MGLFQRPAKAMARWSRPALVLAGLGVVAYLGYRIGPRAVWDSIHALGWRLLVLLWVSFLFAAILDTPRWGILPRPHPGSLSRLVRPRVVRGGGDLEAPPAPGGGGPLHGHLPRPDLPLA